MVRVRNICLVATLLALIACGGGGSSGGGGTGSNDNPGGSNGGAPTPIGMPTPPPPESPLPPMSPPSGDISAAPIVSIVFPLVRSFTEASHITVRGTAQARNGGAIAALRVNGILATTRDAFATWQVSVPLEIASNTLRVETEDPLGNRALADAQVSVVRTARLDAAGPFAIDAANDRVLVYDRTSQSLAAIGFMKSGTRQPFSLPQGEDTLLRSAVNVLLDSANHRALVLDEVSRAIIAVDLKDGSRKVFSPAQSGNLDFGGGNPPDMALDPAHNRVLVLDSQGSRLVAVSLTDGTRSVFLSSRQIGFNFDVDTVKNRAVVCCDFDRRINFVDLDSGTVTPFVSVMTGPVPILFPQEIAIDKKRNRALIPSSDDAVRGLIAVDLNDGTRSLLSGAQIGFVDSLSTFDAIEVDDTGAQLVVTNSSVERIDLATGSNQSLTFNNLALTFDFGVSSGGTDVLLDAPRNRLLILNRDGTRVLDGITLSDGKLAPVFTLPQFVSGTDPSRVALTYDATNDRALIIDEARLITDVKLGTGIGSALFNASLFTTSLDGVGFDGANNRLLLSDASMDKLVTLNLANLLAVDFASGAPLMDPGTILVDAANKRFLTADSGRILGIDAAGGVSVLFAATSDSIAGFGARPRIALDAPSNRVIALGSEGAVIATNLASGTRTILSPVGGPNPLLGGGIAIDSSHQRAFVIGRFGLYAVDLVTGERVLYIN